MKIIGFHSFQKLKSLLGLSSHLILISFSLIHLKILIQNTNTNTHTNTIIIIRVLNFISMEKFNFFSFTFQNPFNIIMCFGMNFFAFSIYFLYFLFLISNFVLFQKFIEKPDSNLFHCLNSNRTHILNQYNNKMYQLFYCNLMLRW